MQSNSVVSFGVNSTSNNGLSSQQVVNSVQQQQQQQQQQQTVQKDTTFTKIFVGGLPYHTTDESLKFFFQKFGNIEEAVVITDRTTGKSRGYGFVRDYYIKSILLFCSQ